MAPYLDYDDLAATKDVDIAAVKSSLASGQAELEGTTPPPVSDDYMYDFKYNHSLPTSDVLGVEIPQSCDARKEAEGIVTQLEEVLSNRDAQSFADLFLPYGQSRALFDLTTIPNQSYRCLA